MTQLSARFLARFDGERRPDAEAVERQLLAAIAEATRRWPGVAADAAVFADWVAARVPAGAESIEAVLSQLRLPELYLTCACACGSELAIAVFDAEFIARDRRSSDDDKQQLRQKLFLSDGDAPPRIERYGGRGDLGRWVRTVAARIAIDGARVLHEEATDDALLDALTFDRGPSPEYAQLKQDARAIVQKALNEAFAELPARERTILLQYHIDGVGVVELGRLYDVAPSTISRNLARIRAFLLARVRRSLMCHHKLLGEELDRLIAFAQSQLSLGGALRHSP